VHVRRVANLDDLLLNIHESRIFQLLLPLDGAVQRLAKLCQAVNQSLEPKLGTFCLLCGTIVGEEACVSSLELNVAARG
jgi:hypothetical protein